MTRPAGWVRVTVETRDNSIIYRKRLPTARCATPLPPHRRFLTCASTGASARWCCGDVGDRGGYACNCAQRLPGTNGITQHYLKVKAQSRTMSQIISVHHNITHITDTCVSRETTKTLSRLHASHLEIKATLVVQNKYFFFPIIWL